MNDCRTIACVIDPDSRGEQLLTQAAAHARRLGARLVAAHFVDHHTGFESDHIPFLAPAELNEALAKAAVERIRAMLDQIDPAASVWVEVGSPRRCAIELAINSGAELVIVGAHNPFGLSTGQAGSPPDHLPFEVLSIPVRRNWNPLSLLRGADHRSHTALDILRA